MSAEELRNVTRLVQFNILRYVKHFLTSPLATAAPRNDLIFIYDLREYREIDRVIAEAALASAYRHLWYLVPEMAVLALFDDNVSHPEKTELKTTLSTFPKLPVYPPGKPGHPAFNAQINKLTRAKPSLSTFISDRSWLLFSLIDANTDWLNEPSDTWNDIPAYQDLKEFCKNIEVVNDVAERAVKDCQDYAKKAATRELRDHMITVAQDHRGRATTNRKQGLRHM